MIYWSIGNYGEVDDNLARAVVRFSKRLLKFGKQKIRIKIRRNDVNY